MVWRRDGNGTLILTQATNQGLCAIGIDPNEGRAAPETAPTGRGGRNIAGLGSLQPNPPWPHSKPRATALLNHGLMRGKRLCPGRKMLASGLASGEPLVKRQSIRGLSQERGRDKL